MSRFSRDDRRLRNAMPPKLDAVTEAVSKSFQADFRLAAATILGTSTSVLHKGFCVEVSNGKPDRSYISPLCLMTIAIAEPSERKSPIYAYTRGIIDTIIDKHNETLQAKILENSLNRETCKQEIKHLKKK